MKPGDIITLVGRTQKGKNRVREHGSTWFVFRVEESGTLMLISPDENPRSDSYMRWMSVTNDQHLEVVG